MTLQFVRSLLWRGRFLALSLLLLGGVELLSRYPGLLDAVAPLLSVAPLLLFPGAALVAYRFHRAEMAHIGLFWSLCAYWQFTDMLAFSLTPAPELLGWGVLLSALLVNRGLTTLWGALQGVALWLPLLLFQLDSSWLPAGIEWLNGELPIPWVFPEFGGGAAAYWLFVIAVATLTVRTLWRPDAVNGGVLLAAVLGGWLSIPGQLPLIAALVLTMTGLALLGGVIQASYGLAYLDQLTTMPGRRALEERMARLGRRYVIAMVDIDHFKKLNDRYGHDVGDEVLKMVAARLKEIRGGGRAYRFGGEEFTVVFPGRELDDALPHLETLRQRIAESRFRLRAGDRPRKRPRKLLSKKTRQVKVTVSCGAAPSAGARLSPAEVLKMADKALYRAKRSGRNRVTS